MGREQNISATTWPGRAPPSALPPCNQPGLQPPTPSVLQIPIQSHLQPSPGSMLQQPTVPDTQLPTYQTLQPSGQPVLQQSTQAARQGPIQPVALPPIQSVMQAPIQPMAQPPTHPSFHPGLQATLQPVAQVPAGQIYPAGPASSSLPLEHWLMQNASSSAALTATPPQRGHSHAPAVTGPLMLIPGQPASDQLQAPKHAAHASAAPLASQQGAVSQSKHGAPPGCSRPTSGQPVQIAATRPPPPASGSMGIGHGGEHARILGVLHAPSGSSGCATQSAAALLSPNDRGSSWAQPSPAVTGMQDETANWLHNSCNPTASSSDGHSPTTQSANLSESPADAAAHTASSGQEPPWEAGLRQIDESDWISNAAGPAGHGTRHPHPAGSSHSSEAADETTRRGRMIRFDPTIGPHGAFCYEEAHSPARVAPLGPASASDGSSDGRSLRDTNSRERETDAPELHADAHSLSPGREGSHRTALPSPTGTKKPSRSFREGQGSKSSPCQPSDDGQMQHHHPQRRPHEPADLDQDLLEARAHISQDPPPPLHHRAGRGSQQPGKHTAVDNAHGSQPVSKLNREGLDHSCRSRHGAAWHDGECAGSPERGMEAWPGRVPPAAGDPSSRGGGESSCADAAAQR